MSTALLKTNNRIYVYKCATSVMLKCENFPYGVTMGHRKLTVHYGLFVKTKLLSFLLAIFFLDGLAYWNENFELEKQILKKIK